MPVTQSFDQLRQANPYRGQSYNKSGWQKFLSALGFRTQADAWEENMSVQAAEYDAALAQKEHDEQYDSAVEQKARLEAAGVNPDLDPSTLSPGNSAPMGEDPSTPMQATGDEQQLLEVGNTIVSCFTSALGLVNGVQGIRRNHLENILLDSEVSREGSGLFDTLKTSFLRPRGENEDMTAQDFYDDAFERAKIFSRKSLPKKMRKSFEAAAENYFSSLPANIEGYKGWYESQEAEKSFYGSKHEFYSPNPDTMDAIYKHLGSAREQIKILGLKLEGAKAGADIEKAQFDEATSSMLDPNKAASAQNAEFDAAKYHAEVQKILRKEVDGLLNDLKNDDSPFAGVFRMLLSCYSLYMFSK